MKDPEALIKHYNAVFDVLVKQAGARESLRDGFVYSHARQSPPVDEFRFIGNLGHGGKYRIGTSTVSCYSEDETLSRRTVIAKTNQALKELGTP